MVTAAPTGSATSAETEIVSSSGNETVVNDPKAAELDAYKQQLLKVDRANVILYRRAEHLLEDRMKYLYMAQDKTLADAREAQRVRDEATMAQLRQEQAALLKKLQTHDREQLAALRQTDQQALRAKEAKLYGSVPNRQEVDTSIEYLTDDNISHDSTAEKRLNSAEKINNIVSQDGKENSKKVVNEIASSHGKGKDQKKSDTVEGQIKKKKESKSKYDRS
jgi:hypothetical protein